MTTYNLFFKVLKVISNKKMEKKYSSFRKTKVANFNLSGYEVPPQLAEKL